MMRILGGDDIAAAARYRDSSCSMSLAIDAYIIMPASSRLFTLMPILRRFTIRLRLMR